MRPASVPLGAGGRVGLLVVHGIGRQRGAEAAETLARHLGDEPPEDVSKASGSSRFQVRVGGIPVLVREASWADRSDLANPPSILDASALLKQLRDSFLEVGRRILKGTPASGRKLLSLLVLTSLALNLAAVTVMIVVAFVAPTRGTDAPPSAPGPRDPLALGVGFTIFLLALCGGYVAAMRVLGDGRERHRKWRLSRPVLSIAAFGFGFLGTLFISTLLSVLLTYLVWFALIAAGINLAARPLVRPLRWLGGAAVAGHGWRLVRALGTFLNLASNLMIVLPVHALLQATKAYVNLFSVVLLGGGEARRALPADSNGPRWTRAKAIAWGLATTLGVIVLLLVCEIVLYPVWLPLVLSSDSSAASLGEAWFAVVIGWGLLMWALRVPLDWLFDVSNYQVGSQRDRDRLFFGVLGEAVEDLRRHGCTEVHVVAHSLGSALVYDWLRESTGEAPFRVASLHTLGSPLNKFWFLDHTIGGRRRDQSPLATVPPGAWRNYWSRSDPVSGALSRYAGVEDRRIQGLGPWFLSHTRYWRNPEFLASVRELVRG